MGFACLLEGMVLRFSPLDHDTRREMVSMWRELLHRIELDEASYQRRVAAGRQR